MTDGIEVRVRGRLGLYERRGTVQLRMTWIDPEYTAGRLAAQREHLLATLAGEGLLDRNSHRPLPLVPLHVGLIGSTGSAAVADFIHELEESGHGWHVTVADARVQGTGAVASMTAALRNVLAEGVDVVAIVRGGGASTDLAVFDDERLARAIADSSIPVLTGIGHEIDRTVADVVAHTAFKTPTACAAGLVSLVATFATTVDRHSAAVAGLSLRALSLAERNLLHRSAGLGHASMAQIKLAEREVEIATRRLGAVAARSVERAEAAVARAEAVVAAASPDRLLARGFSITRSVDGRIVRAPSEVEVGDRLVTELAGGRVNSRVEPGGERG